MQSTMWYCAQGAWYILRKLVADNAGFEGWERMLPHIDEAMSWESVRYSTDAQHPAHIIHCHCHDSWLTK